MVFSFANCVANDEVSQNVEAILDCDANLSAEGCEALTNLNGDTTTTQTSDADSDGVLDAAPDNCVSDANADQADMDGDGLGDACDDDTDGDRKLNTEDNCISVANNSQDDQDGDEVGDACDEDVDGDDLVDASEDNCPTVNNVDQIDTDGDGLGDFCDDDIDNDGVSESDGDNCPYVVNVDQANSNGDHEGDACELDSDADGVYDDEDNCDNTSNTDQADANTDGVGDACEGDADGDGVFDNTPDNCPSVANADQTDLDEDGIGDVCDDDMDGDGAVNADDLDDDNDGLNDTADLCPKLKDTWYVFQNTKTIELNHSDCPDADANGSYYLVRQIIYPNTGTVIEACSQTPGEMVNEKRFATETQAAICVLSIGLAGYCDSSYQDIDSDDFDITKAINYKESALFYDGEIRNNEYSDVYTTSYYGTWQQKDTDGDGMGDACDAQPNHASPSKGSRGSSRVETSGGRFF